MTGPLSALADRSSMIQVLPDSPANANTYFPINGVRKFPSSMISFLDHAPASRSARNPALDLETRQLPQRRAQAASVATSSLQPDPGAGDAARDFAARPDSPSPADHRGGIGGPETCRADDRPRGELSRALRRARPAAKDHPHGRGGLIRPHAPFVAA